MDILIVHDKVMCDAPTDRQDTLEQAATVAEALRYLGHEVRFSEVTLDLASFSLLLEKRRPQLVWNLVETLGGASFLHVVPLVCERAHVPVTGGSSECLYLTSNKVVAKRLLQAVGIATPLWIDKRFSPDPSLLCGQKVIVKPESEEGSVGITDDMVRDAVSEEELYALLHASDRFVERFIEGREFNISILARRGEPIVLPIAEMLFLDYPMQKPRIVSYEAKWKKDSFADTHTQRTFSFKETDRVLLEKLENMAKTVWRLFGAKGYARVDIRVDQSQVPYVLEMNSNPSLSPDSGFCAAAAEAGLRYEQVIEQIIEDGLYGYS